MTEQGIRRSEVGERRCNNADHNDAWGCPCFDSGARVAKADHEGCVVRESALIKRAETAEADRDALAAALRCVADGKVMTQTQPWPDSAEDHLDHARMYAHRVLVEQGLEKP